MDIYINQKKIKLSPRASIGKGGEADVFKIGNDKAVKVFKVPSHPDYQGSPFEQQAAGERLKEHQTKLRQFPQNLSSSVMKPEELATDRSGQQIVGYTMPFLKDTTPLLKYGDRSFRFSSGIDHQTIIEIFRHLHGIIKQIHAVQVVIGDFNDLNILIKDTQPYLIDADSYQYGQFLCRVYTSRFVDPLLCDDRENKPILSLPHNFNSDWYAFTVMLMQCLLFVDPYGGVYKPKNKQHRIPHTARPLKRITVFHSEVKYPKPALPYDILPDDLLQYFHQCFERDQRGEFPQQILGNISWRKCQHCGLEYATISCPNCTQIQQLKPITPVTVRGTVTCTQIFRTQGVILTARLQEKLAWLYYDRGQFKREDDRVIFAGELDKQTKFWLDRESALIGKQGQVIILNSANNAERIATDSYHNLPVLNCNQWGRYWLYNGQLLKEAKLGQEYIGDVLAGQTQFWLGDKFGFGYYSAGNLRVAFVFDAKTQGINDQIKLPPWQGQVIEANCIFSNHLCWFFLSIQTQGKLINKVFVIEENGQIIAQTEAEKASHSWLSQIHGHCAVNNFLLAVTDEGIIRLEVQNNQIVKTKEFPDTEPFIDASCQLIPSAQGLYVISQQEIKLLQIKTK
jgi:H/ACA ribonucleoprotein complex subunit 3